MTPDSRPLVIFDDACAFCHRGVRLILRLDRRGIFRFTGRHSEVARRVVRELMGEAPRPNSMLLVEDGVIYSRSDVPLRVAGRLGLPWRLASVFALIPKPIRDWVYDRVAENRHRLSGRRACPVPTPELRARLLD